MKSSTDDSSSRLHPLLRGLPEDLIGALNDCSSQSHFAPGKVICEAGKSASKIMLLQQGQVSLEVTLGEGGTTQVGILGPGDFLGCAWFGQKHNWPLTARALGEVTAQSIYAARLQELFESSPEAGKDFALRLARGMDEQLAGARNQIARVSRLALESQVMALEAFAGEDTR
ncbi:MAG: Crp/Fnr family transcriptional regulator [Limisphaerales bacterium]